MQIAIYGERIIIENYSDDDESLLNEVFEVCTDIDIRKDNTQQYIVISKNNDNADLYDFIYELSTCVDITIR